MLRTQATDVTALGELQGAWQAVIGQSSGITWHYMLMLAGVPGIKPDRMITRFLMSALDITRRAPRRTFVIDIVTQAARTLAVTPTNLDHAIWQWQRKGHPPVVRTRLDSTPSNPG